MTRQQQITDLRAQYAVYAMARKWKAATAVQLRLQSLMTRQLRAENRNRVKQEPVS